MALDKDGNQELPDDFDEPTLVDDDEGIGDDIDENEVDGKLEKPKTVDVQEESGDAETGDDIPPDEKDGEVDTTVSQDGEPGDGGDEKPEETPEETAAEKKLAKSQAEYGRKVQRRINKEVKQREQLRSENAALQQRFDELESRIATDQTASNKALVEGRLRNATAMKQQMMDDGENERVAQIDNDIMDMKIYLRDLDKEQAPAQLRTAAPQEAYIPTKQKKWMDGNKRFNKDAGYTAYINEEYDKLVDEGYDPEDETLYVELDTRIGRKSKKPAGLGKKRPVPAPSPNITPPGGGSKPKVGKLTSEDKQRMRDWDLNPDDPNVRKEWLRNKRAS